MAAHRHDATPPSRVIKSNFDDIDAMATSPFAWRQEYDQIGRGRFRGMLAQLVLDSIQLARVQYSPGVLQRGMAPPDTWVFGLPIKSEGTLHARRRPAQPGELLAATSRDDIGFAATGDVDLMVVVLPEEHIESWLHKRRGDTRFDTKLNSPHLALSSGEMMQRAMALADLLNGAMSDEESFADAGRLARIEDGICSAVLDIIPSAEVIEPLHHRARVARELLAILRENVEHPLTITELCERTGAKERTLYLCCIEAFGRPPQRLLTELRLNGVRRALTSPKEGTNVTQAAASFGFVHFGRFAQAYAQMFSELPSVTLARATGQRAGA
jgi:AraC family ethanolamine operon transcriptional activator